MGSDDPSPGPGTGTPPPSVACSTGRPYAPGMPHFDVVVLGAGPGGYVAAIRAAQLGKSVAVVEEKYWGGVCLNVGCIPSKALLRNAELAHLFANEKQTFGITGEVSFDYGAAFDRSRVVADGRVKGVHFLMKKNKITEFDGWGTFTDPNTLHVDLAQGGFENVTFDNVHPRDRCRDQAASGHLAVRAGGHLRGADPDAGAARQRHHRRRGGDRRRVRLRPQQLRGAGHDRRVPRPDAPAGGRGGLQGTRQARTGSSASRS